MATTTTTCWWQSEIDQAIAAVQEYAQGHAVVHVKPIEYGYCMESYPCKGHVGAIVEFLGRPPLRLECSTPAIGGLYKRFIDPECLNTPKARHFINYAPNTEYIYS